MARIGLVGKGGPGRGKAPLAGFPGGFGGGISNRRYIVALVLVCLLVTGTLWAAGKFGPAGSDPPGGPPPGEISARPAPDREGPGKDAPAPGTAPETEVTVHFIDVGKGDAILVMARGGSNVLIDAGDPQHGQTVTGYLKKQGVKSLALLVATHPHDDHIGGMLAVLRSVEVKRVLDSGVPHNTYLYADFLKAVEDKKIPYETPNEQTYDLAPGVALRILGPRKRFYNLNDNSIVAMLEAGKVSFLFTGDVEGEAERDLYKRHLRASILKVAHHGSNTSTAEGFLSRVLPIAAVISTDGDSSNGHPSKAVLDLLARYNVRIFRTDIDGTVVVRTDGRTFEITATKATGRN